MSTFRTKLIAFLLNYSNLLRGPLFIWTLCSRCTYGVVDVDKVPELCSEYCTSTVDWQPRGRHDDVELLLEVACSSLQEP